MAFAIASLQKEIDLQKQKIIDVELKHSDQAASMIKLKEFSDMITKMTNKECTLHEECQKGIYDDIHRLWGHGDCWH